VLCVVIVSRWFVARRGLALGLMLAGTSLGNSLYPSLNTWLIQEYGWRPAFSYIAAIPLLLIPLILLAIKEWPQHLGLQPFGAASAATTAAQSATESVETRALSYGDILGSPNFWFLGLAAFFTFYSILGLSSNLFLHARQLGYAPPDAAALFAPLFLLGIVGKVGFGWLADRLGVKPAWAVSLALMLAGALLLATLDRSLVLIGVSLFGLGWGGNYSLLQLLTADVFGARSIGKAMGAINVLDAGGGALGPFVTGVLYDVSGNYQLGFSVIVALVAFAMVMLVLVRLPRKA
jgi:MFS family permease